MLRTNTFIVPALALAAITAATARGQANDEIDAGVQFDFSLPGARSMAMGGAFLGAADDATAAYTNPAGITTLETPEISLEGRAFRWSTEVIAGGHAPGAATGIGPDTHTGLLFEEFEDTTTGLSFASFVYPRDRWSFALYRHELANFEAHGDGGGEFVTAEACSSLPYSTCRRVYFRAALDMRITSYGAAAAYRLGESFRVGVAVAWYDGAVDGVTRRYHSVNPDGIFNDAPPDYSDGNLVATTIQHVDDGAVAGSIGFTWKATDWLDLGAVYRQGPSFRFEGTVLQAQSLIDICPTCFHDVYLQGTFHVPDVYGVGVMFHAPRVPVHVALDVNRVRYSQIMEGFVNIVAGIANDTNFEKATPTYFIEDATEVRLGAEYVLDDWRLPTALRVGAWYDPDHRLRNNGTFLPTEKTRFAGGSDQIHATAGLGLVIGKHLQIDAAVDLGESYDATALSAVVFF